MVTNFFQAFGSLDVQSECVITIKKDTPETLTVSLLIKNANVKDVGYRVIPPMVLRGTPENLDSGFFNAISEPAKKTDQLFCNMEAYEKAQETAKKQSKVEKDKTDTDKKEKDSKKKNYEVIMKKVTDLEKENKFAEAIEQLPDAKEYPEFATEINKKNIDLMQKNITRPLF